MERGKPCKVCGYSPSTPQPQPSAQPPARERKRKRRGIFIGAAALLACGLLALGYAILRPSGQPDQSAAVSPPPGPAVTQEAAQEAAAQEAAAPSSTAIVLNPEEQAFDITARTDLPPFTGKEQFVRWMTANTNQQASFLRQRWNLAGLLAGWGDLKHQRVRDAFLLTPREFFCRNPRRAYANVALPIGYGQTISGPDLVSHMTDYLDPLPQQKVLEIGTGSGYQSAVLSELSNHVYTVEIIQKLARETDAIYNSLEPTHPEYRNILRKIDDGYYGWKEYAPFDKIIVTCGIDHVPPPLIQQLAPGGTMIIPIGPPAGQTVLRLIKTVNADGSVSLSREDIYHGRVKIRFVPLTGWGGGAHQAP